MRNVEVETLLNKFKELIAEAYERGAKEALKRIMEVAQFAGGQKESSKAKSRTKGSVAKKGVKKAAIKTRAPRGAPRALVERVIGAKGGASASEIAAAAVNAVEKSVSTSAIRLELNRGKKERRYRVSKGKWSFAKTKAS